MFPRKDLIFNQLFIEDQSEKVRGEKKKGERWRFMKTPLIGASVRGVPLPGSEHRGPNPVGQPEAQKLLNS